MSLGRYAIIVLGITALSLALLWPWVLGALEPRGRLAAVAGGGLATLNALAAYGLVRWGGRRSTRTFLKALLWGMLGRLAFLLGAFAAAIVFLGLPIVPLTASLVSYFVVFLVLELAVFHRQSREVPAR